MTKTQIPAAVTAILFLASCSGRGTMPAMGGPAQVPAGAAIPAPVFPPSKPGFGKAVFTITVPNATKADYVSTNTRSAVIEMTSPKSEHVATFTLAPKAPGCAPSSGGYTCTKTVDVTAARDHFRITTYDGPKGHGKALSVARTAAKIVEGKTTNVPLALEGVVASVSVELEYPSPKAAPTSDPVIVTAKDASGATIVGGDDYDKPIKLTDEDGSGATSLSNRTVRSPSSDVSLKYDGSATLVRAIIDAKSPGVPSSRIEAGSMVPLPTNATESVSEQVDAGVGATLKLPSGTSVDVPANALAQSSVVQVAVVPSPAPAATAGALTPISAAVQVTLGVPQQNAGGAAARRAHAGTVPQITITIEAPISQAELRHRSTQRKRPHYYGYYSSFALAILNVCDADGCHVTVGNPQQTTTTLTLKIFDGIFDALTPITAFSAYLATLPATESLVNPGLRYWDPNATPVEGAGHWTTEYPPSNPSHPVLLIHGIFSSVEASFSDAMVEQLRANGGYDAVIGYDYDWMDTADHEAQNVLNDVGALGYPNLDIVAHSMGTLVAMGTAGGLAKLGTDPYSYYSYPTIVQNCILIEGPLNGSLSVKPEMLMTDMAYIGGLGGAPVVGGSEMIGALGVLVLYTPWAQQFAPGSDVSNTVETAFRNAPPVRVQEVAGNQPLVPWEPEIYELITQGPMPSPNDGVMPTSSEIWPVLPSPNPAATPYGVPPEVSMVIDNATHAGSNDITNNLLYEQYIQQQIEFSVDNADPATGIYEGVEPSVFMKGIGTQTSLCVFDDATVSFAPEAASLNAALIETRPAPPPLGPWQMEAADPSTCSDDTTYFFNLIANGPAALTPTAPPSQATVFDTKDSDGTVATNAVDLDIWALPACTVGPTTGPGGCLYPVNGVSEERALRILDAFKHGAHRKPKHPISVRSMRNYRR